MKVELEFFNDGANGEWGVTHKQTMHQFNAFWSEFGFFHDVFEHYFELDHPYFMDDYGLNLGGEIAAMGHAFYYGRIGMRSMRFGRTSYSYDESVMYITHSDMLEGIYSGYTDFGDELLCKIPFQRFQDYWLDSFIDEHWCRILDLKKEGFRGSPDEEQEKETSIRFAKSLTQSKLKRFYKWGYQQAESICPLHTHGKILYAFVDYWKKFCEMHTAEDLKDQFKQICFTITPGEDFSWDCDFVSHDDSITNYKNFQPI